MMKRSFFKTCAVLLCMLVCFCGAGSVFAKWIALQPADTTQGQILVELAVKEGEEIPVGMCATAFRIILVNVHEGQPGDDPLYQPAEPVYTWAPGVVDWVHEKYPTYIEKDTTDVVSTEYTKLAKEDGSPSEAIAPFIDALAAAIKSRNPLIKFKWEDGSYVENQNPLVASAPISTTNNTATITGLSKGSYLVLIENGNKIYQPSVANLTPSWETVDGKAGWFVNSPAEITIKSSDVSVDKTVSANQNGPFRPAASASIGERVYFEISAIVPQYSANAVSKKFVIRDTLSAGLSLSDNPVVYGIKGTESVELKVNTEYQYSEGDGTETPSFTVNFADYDKVKEYSKIRITYGALVTKDAVTGTDGNPNDVWLDYSNNPYVENSSKTTEDKAIVYTYGLNLTKTNKNNTENLAGAVFELQRQTAAGAWETIQIVKDGADVGKYRVAKTGDGIGQRIETDDDGKLLLRGLDTGDYQLIEVQAPAGGYVLLKDPIPFSIIDNKNAAGESDTPDGIPEDKVSGVNISGEDAKQGYVSYSVSNSKGFDLPLTGGMGTLLFTAGGVILFAAAVVLLVLVNRKKSRRR